MKRFTVCILIFILILSLIGCAANENAGRIRGGENGEISAREKGENRAGDNMTKAAPRPSSENSGSDSVYNKDASESVLKISIRSEDYEILYRLNDSPAAKSLADQLPLTLAAEDFSINEKIFYPPNALSVSGSPLAEGGAGSLCYYSPWGDVVMFYGDFEKNDNLYMLGEAVSGQDDIEKLNGIITITICRE